MKPKQSQTKKNGSEMNMDGGMDWHAKSTVNRQQTKELHYGERGTG
jgi:hypothetical protein